MKAGAAAHPAPEAARATRVRLVDDDAALCSLLQGYLAPLGYALDLRHDGPGGLAAAMGGGYEAVILDVRLPGMNGIEILRRLRERSAVPVIMWSTLGDEPDRVAGLEIGADDYLPKSASPRELVARLRAVIRRSALSARRRTSEAPGEPLTVGDLTIDPATREVRLKARRVPLTTAEFDVLWCLARSPGRVRSREELLQEAAERGFESFDRTVDVHISALRKKLGDDPRAPRLIETVRGVGYRIRRPGL